MLIWSQLDAAQQAAALSRPALANNAALNQQVAAIIAEVRASGDSALLALGRQFDSPALTELHLDRAALEQLASQVDTNTQQAIDVAYENILRFHQAQRPAAVSITTTPGVVCEQHFAPIERVGLYIPGGTAPLPSTVLMLAIPAAVAECRVRVLCTPANAQGKVAPEIAYAALRCGINQLFLCGGAQAVAAMAFGTETVPAVDKIFGPGNRFVTAAKQQVSQQVEGAAIDMPAGPSEVLVIADAQADPSFVAADLLSQAEHGTDSQAILVCDSEALIAQVQDEVQQQLRTLSRQSVALQAMQHARYILTASVAESIEVSNRYAPEHLIVQVEEARSLLPRLTNAGSIFLGRWSPESAGDYASGTNHVLPTYGYARNYSSLGLLDFMRRYTVQELSAAGMRELGPAIATLARAEGLDAHERAVTLRLAKLSEETEK